MKRPNETPPGMLAHLLETQKTYSFVKNMQVPGYNSTAQAVMQQTNQGVRFLRSVLERSLFIFRKTADICGHDPCVRVITLHQPSNHLKGGLTDRLILRPSGRLSA